MKVMLLGGRNMNPFKAAKLIIEYLKIPVDTVKMDKAKEAEYEQEEEDDTSLHGMEKKE